MAYNPYQDIQKVYNAKVNWNKATTDEERKRQNEIASAARKNLEAYGYSDVAGQISASGADATAARKILERYAPKTTTTTTPTTTKATTVPDSTTLTNPELITTNNNETRNKINQLWGTQTSDRDTMTGKYNKLESTAYANPFETEEGKAIIGKYDLDAMQGRENELASGSASNGGNIDSFAAANALRQQAELTAKGQMVALDAHNNKINNVKGILADLGVYLQNQDKGMQTTIGIQQEEGQRLFENDETAKNNEVARLSEQANVTGYTPTEWTIKNDAVYSQFLNPDGTFKKEMEGTDIQALINSTTDADTKKKLAVVRAKKMLGNYGQFGQYINQGDVAFMDGQVTEARRQFDTQDKLARDTLAAEVNVNNANNQNKLDLITAETNANKDLLEFQAKLSDGANTKLSEDGADIFKQVSKNINKQLAQEYGDKYGLADDYEIIQWNGGSDYKLNLPKGHVDSWWKTQVIRPIIESSLSEDDQIAVLSSLFGDNAAQYYADVYTSMQNNGQIK
jgi:hypothetical protein